MLDPFQFFGVGSQSLDRSLFIKGQTGFNGTGLAYTQETISIPAWAKFMFASLCAPGIGGGGGFSGAAGTARGGGGGGAVATTMNVLIPTALLPGQIILRVGHATMGGSSGVAPIGPTDTRLIHPSFGGIPAGTVIIAATGTAQQMSNASAAAAGTAGAFSGAVLPNVIGIGSSVSGTPGTAGGAPTGAAGANAGTASNLIAGGAGGGSIGTANAVFAGGNVVTARGSIPGGSGDGGNGSDGYMVEPNAGRDFLFKTGGSGGASGTLQGGRGGNGGWGASGGGGGGGVTGGLGGNGGPGFAWIIFF